MTDRFKRNLLIISAAVILYLVLFPTRLGMEPLISRDMMVPADSVAGLPALAPNETTYPLYFGKSLYFLADGGGRAFHVADATSLSLGNRNYAQRGQGGQVQIFRRSGEAVATIDNAGSPYFDGDTLCVVSDTGNALSVYTDSGEFRWHFEADDLISAFAAGPKGDSFVGTIDGRVFWIDGQGNVRTTVRPGHGAQHVVYGLLWIEAQNSLAVLADVRPQALVFLRPAVAKDGGARLRETKNINIPQETRHPVVLQTVLRDRYLVLEQPQGIGVVSVGGNDQRIIALDGALQRLVGIADAGIMVVSIEGETGESLVGFKPDGRVVFRQKIRSRIDDIGVDRQGRLLVSAAPGIMALDFYIR